MARIQTASPLSPESAMKLYQPGAPLQALAPGALAKLTPAQRALALKRSKKGLMPNTPLTNPAQALGT